MNEMLFIDPKIIVNTDLDFNIDIFKGLMSEIFLTEKDKLRLKAKKLKPKVIEYLKINKEATTLQIARFLDISFEDAYFILKTIEKEGKIKIC